MLAGIGSGILKDLENSLRESAVVAEPAGGRLDKHEKIETNQSKGEQRSMVGDKIGDSTLDAFNDSSRLRKNEPKQADSEIAGSSIAVHKKVHFAEEESIYSISRSNAP